MYVSTAKVLRQFARKMAASITPELDRLEKVELEPKKPAPTQGPQDAPRTGFAGKSTDPIVNAVENATRGPSLTHSALSGLDSAIGAGKSLGGMMMASPGYTALGAGLGGAGLYGLARLLQSEEDRKKRRPIVAPALGAVGGAVALPALLAALSGNKAPDAASKAPANGLPVVHETHHV